jgi:hypothetical protein
MIYKYNVCYSNISIREDTLNKIRSKVESIRSDAPQEIGETVRNTIFISEKTTPPCHDFNTFVICHKAKSFYAIAAIRTDNNYKNQWLILKNPIDGYKNVVLNRTESADTNLYRRMTVEEIKKYLNDYDELFDNV